MHMHINRTDFVTVCGVPDTDSMFKIQFMVMYIVMSRLYLLKQVDVKLQRHPIVARGTLATASNYFDSIERTWCQVGFIMK